MRVTASLLSVLLLCGCSLAFVRGPSVSRTTCTSDNTVPAVDTVIAVAMLVTALGGLGYAATYDQEGDGGVVGTVVAVPAAITSLAFTGSAVYGFRSTGSCRSTASAATANH